ncbi:hypothetical protein VKT23_019807 [Stygiomarasmius scandens]|uniref:Uncharacterized protein n=1 Tax=Marasmiellus scandens TaxID=2682957 RepID=A0ABR1IME4_9AGAR
MFSKAILVALTAALGVVASPAPIQAAELDARAPAASPTVKFCTAANFGGICINAPVVSDSCTSFTGGLTTLNEEVSSAVVPAGFICTLFSQFGCTTADPANSDQDQVALTGGSYANFKTLQGINGAINYNDKTSSFSCSPL